jgi:hypothetical protein
LIGATGSANAALNQIKIISAIYGVPGDPVRTRDVRAKAQALVDNGETEFQVARLAEGDDPAYMVVKTATITYSVGSVEKTVVGQDPDTISLDDISDSGTRINRIHGTSTGHYVLETTSPGEYNVKTASGRSLVATVPPLPDPVTLDTPWNIKFPPGQGAILERQRRPERPILLRHSDVHHHGHNSKNDGCSRQAGIPKSWNRQSDCGRECERP